MPTVCPSCHRPAIDPNAPCPACRREPGAPLAGATGQTGDAWDEDDLASGLDFSRGGAMTSSAHGPSAYSGGGLSLGDDDDPFAESSERGFELDVPASHSASSQRSIPAASGPFEAPPRSTEGGPSASPPSFMAIPSSASIPARSHDSGQRRAASSPPADPSVRAAGAGSLPPRSGPRGPSIPPRSAGGHSPDPAAIIARYPATPTKVWEAPGYAIRVLWRQLELRQDLATLRKRRSPDVPLYESALGAHDPKTFALGLVMTCAGLVVASFVFFLPVILRILRNSD